MTPGLKPKVETYQDYEENMRELYDVLDNDADVSDLIVRLSQSSAETEKTIKSIVNELDNRSVVNIRDNRRDDAINEAG